MRERTRPHELTISRSGAEGGAISRTNEDARYPTEFAMRMYLIRHGVTLPSGPDSHEWPLAPEGESQAETLADGPFWQNVAALYSSPEGKTLSTVRPASKKHGLEIREDERLREARRPARWYDDYDDVARRYLEERGNSPEGWEDPREVEARMRKCFGELAERHIGEGIAVCGHGLAPVLYLRRFPAVAGNVFDFWRSIGFCRVAVVEGGTLVGTFKDPSGVH